MTDAGFTGADAWLAAEPIALEPGQPLREHLRTIGLGAHLERLPAARREAFVEAVACRLPSPVIDHVRLNILATPWLRSALRGPCVPSPDQPRHGAPVPSPGTMSDPEPLSGPALR